MIEQIIFAFAESLYPGYDTEYVNFFRVTRDADIEVAEDEAEDLLYEIKEQVILRIWGKAAVRLEVCKAMPKDIVHFFFFFLSLNESDIYRLNRPVNLGDFMALMSLDVNSLKDKPFTAKLLPDFNNKDVFEAISANDILVHHPFDSFTNSVLKFINQAADDPNVVAIKMTLYRTGKNSSVIATLKRAAIAGKNVTALVELKARFDEENNIIWAKELENSGIHVVYGVPGLKTHCKILMVVRREDSQLKTYLHLSTGNYNQITARVYTDFGFFTSNEDFVADGIHLFNFLTGYSQPNEWKHFIVAPKSMKNKIIEFIRREAELHTVETPGLIFAKFNALAHREIIEELYRASQKGVQIKLLCRGICSLRPGIKGISENIEVRSILGRFLEHNRIYHFKNSGTYLGSADLMSRNMHRRVELLFPILNPKLRDELLDVLENYWSDNTKSWVLRSDGTYEKKV
jgi:polyphosphate kinase